MLQVAGRTYEIREVEFEVTLDTSGPEIRYEWDLDLRAHAGESMPVRISTHALHTLEPDPWMPHPLTFREWSAALPDTDPDGEPAFLVYCHEHEALRDVFLQARNAGRGVIELSITARADLYVAEDCPTEDVEIVLREVIRLGGFYVRGSSEAEASALLFKVVAPSEVGSPVRRGPGFLFPLRDSFE